MRRQFQPFASGGRRTIVGILVTFALFSALSVTLSIWTTKGSQHRAAVVEVAARQRTLAERYVKEILLARAGARVDPQQTASVMAASAGALLNGGTAPAVWGDDDETTLPAASGTVVRRQLEQERRLVSDLQATGSSVLAGRPVAGIRLRAHEHLKATSPIDRLRVLASLTSNVSLNAARTIAAADDQNVNHLIIVQAVLGALGLLVSLALGWVLIVITRRKTEHFRSLVISSTDLVLVLGPDGCRYAGHSVGALVGKDESALLGYGYEAFVHLDDRPALRSAAAHGGPREVVFRMRDQSGEWRRLESHLTDLRQDRLVRGVVLNSRDITERVELERQLTHQAFHDTLTGLANRALFRDRLEHALAHSERSGQRLAVMLADLDGFKQVNDSLGHDAGDQLLREVGRRFSRTVRASDTVARFGGDEFAFLLENVTNEEVIGLARRLLDQLALPIVTGGRDVALGASVGIVLHTAPGSTSEELISQADVAMYAAKDSGRGRYELYCPEMAKEIGELLEIEQELRLGLQRGEFSLHYQPELDLESERIVGAEALLRWQSPTRGLVSPARFIPIAETNGLIVALGEFVLRQACTQASEWRKAGLVADSFVTWVNVSAKQLDRHGFQTVVQQALAEAGLPASALGIEVTESTIIERGAATDHARAELADLHRQGVHIAIDDFGTGFSSLGQLRHFPIDMIKVDYSFVQGAEHDAKDAAITANLVNLAHALGIVAIAEGIESPGQLSSLQSLGCDLGQGYLLGRPMPPDQLEGFLSQRRSRLVDGKAVA